MKHKLFFNKLWLRVGMIVAIMTTALSGTVWAETVTWTISGVNTTASGGSNVNTTLKTSAISPNTETGVWTAVASSSYAGSNSGAQLGSGNYTFAGTVTLSGSAIPSDATITRIDINLSSSGTAYKIDATVGGSAFGSQVSVNQKNATAYSFTGTGTGNNIQLTFSNGGKKNVIIKSISVTYSTGGTPLTDNDLTLNATSKSFDLADGDGQTFQLTNSGSADGALSYESSNTAVATVSNTGLITAVGEGTTTITVTQAASETYAGGTATCTVTVTDSRYSISDLTFTAACNGSGTADDNVAWTVASDGTESAFDNTKGIHYGTGSVDVQYITLTTSGINGTIAKIVVNASTANDVSATASVTVGGAAFGGEAQSLTSSAADYTFTGSASGEIVVTVTKPESATKALYVKSVKVYYIPSTDPYITAEDVTIAYDATSGSIGYSLTNATGNVTATVTDGDWLTLGTITSSAVPFTCTANANTTARTATVTLSFSGAEDKVVTVTQTRDPNALMTIAEARAQGTGNVHTKGIVTSSVGTTAYIQDANAAICVYGESLTVGDEIEVSGTLTDFHGLLEITEPTVTVLSQENTVTPEVLTIAQVKASTKQGWLVKIENATVTEVGSNNNYTIAQGDETITLHGALGEVAVNDVITFTGNIGYYNSVQLVNPTDVTVTGTVTPTTYTLSWTAGEHTELFVFDAADETTQLTNGDEIAAGTTINVSIDVDEGYQLDALTVKDADDNDVTLTEITAGSYYSFTMPGSNVTINATATESSVTPTTGGKYVKVTSTEDITDGQYLIVYEDGSVAFNGGLGTLDAVGNTIEVTISNNEIAVTEATAAAEFTIDVTAGTILSASGFYIGQTSNANGLASSKETNYTNTITFTDSNADIVSSGGAYLRYNSASNQTRFRYYKSSSYTSQQAIQLYKKVEATPETRTLNAQGYATFASTSAVNFDDTEITAWAVTAVSGSTITFAQVTGNIAAETGLLLKGAADATISPETVASGNTPAGNRLVGIVEDTPVNAYEYYGLSGQNFVKVKAGTVKAGRALLPASVVNPTSGNGEAKVFTFVFEDDATGIKTIETVSAEEAAQIFNLAGQRISKMQKGINIVNGKKIAVK